VIVVIVLEGDVLMNDLPVRIKGKEIVVNELKEHFCKSFATKNMEHKPKVLLMVGITDMNSTDAVRGGVGQQADEISKQNAKTDAVPAPASADCLVCQINVLNKNSIIELCNIFKENSDATLNDIMLKISNKFQKHGVSSRESSLRKSLKLKCSLTSSSPTSPGLPMECTSTNSAAGGDAQSQQNSANPLRANNASHYAQSTDN